MGNSSSSSGTSSSNTSGWTQERKDLKEFAEKFAFGDDELRHVYRAYHSLNDADDKKPQRRSFIQDWGLACYDPDSPLPTSPTTERGEENGNEGGGVEGDSPPLQEPEFLTREERIDDRQRRLRQADAILGDFGNRLYAATFLAVGDKSIYKTTTSPSGPTNEATLQRGATTDVPGPVLVDEYTRKSRLEAVFEGLAKCSRRGSQATITALFHVLDLPKQGEDDASVIDAMELVTIGYHLALATAILSGDVDDVPLGFHDDSPTSAPSRALQAFVESLVERAESSRQRYGHSVTSKTKSGTVELPEVLEWVDVACPVFASILPSFLWQLFFPNRPYPPSRTFFTYPTLLLSMAALSTSTSHHSHATSSGGDDDNDVDDEHENRKMEEEANRLLNPVFRYVLACWSSSLNGPYVPLFNSEQDGLSFNRLQNALVGYSGPTLLVVSADNCTFGAYTSSKWREAKDFYGTSDTFLCALSPKTRVYRPTLRNECYQYCNSTARSRGYDQQAHGLGFGGTVHRPRLFLSESFEDCNADKQDLTFDNGPLLLLGTADGNGSGSSNGSTKFSPDSLQVWAVGGQAVVEAALHERGHHRDVVEQGIRRARKVDKAQFLDDLRSGTIESKAFAYRQQIDGRADQDVADRVQKERDVQKQRNMF